MDSTQPTSRFVPLLPLPLLGGHIPRFLAMHGRTHPCRLLLCAQRSGSYTLGAQGKHGWGLHSAPTGFERRCPVRHLWRKGCGRSQPNPVCKMPAAQALLPAPSHGLQWCFHRVGKRVIIDGRGNLILRPT